MRKIMISFCMLCAVLALKAQTVSGIRVDGGDAPILVYLGGNQMCLPTTTCFVANLKAGYYTVEVYATRFTRPGERVWKGERLYSERVYFNGNNVKEINVKGQSGNASDYNGQRPSTTDRYNGKRRYRAMDDAVFKTFLKKVKDEPFSDDRLRLIQTAAMGGGFTSAQCLQLVKLYSFDDDKQAVMKLLYPAVVDKEAFFMVIDELTFDDSRANITSFIRKYNEKR